MAFTDNTGIQINSKMRNVLDFAGYTLSIVSIIFTVMLLTSLSDSSFDKLLMAATGIGFEVSKFAFVPIALLFFQRGHYKAGAASFVIGIALVMLSLSASVGFLHSKVDSSALLAKESSVEYKMIMSQVDQLDTQINNLNAAAAVDATSRYRQVRDGSSLKTQQAEQLGERKVQLLSSLENINGLEMTSSGSLFLSIASMIDAEPQKVKFYAHLIVAVLIELCAIAALSLSGIAKANAIKNENIQEEHEEQQDHRINVPNVPKSEHQVFSNQNIGNISGRNKNVYPLYQTANIKGADEVPSEQKLTLQEMLKEQARQATFTLKDQEDMKAQAQDKPVSQVLNSKPKPKKTKTTVVREQGDTAVKGSNANRFESVVTDIKEGRLKPTVREIKAKKGCGYEVAKKYLEQMYTDGVLLKERTSKGEQYKLA